MLEGSQKQTEHLKSSIWLSHLVTRNFFRQLTLWDNWGKKEAYKGCHFIPSATKGFISLNIFSRMAVAVHMHAKHFEFNILVYKKKNFPLHYQTSLANLFSQLVNLPTAWLLNDTRQPLPTILADRLTWRIINPFHRSRRKITEITKYIFCTHVIHTMN